MNPKFKITTINMKWSRKHFCKVKNLLDHFKQLQPMYLEDILYTIYRLKLVEYLTKDRLTAKYR